MISNSYVTLFRFDGSEGKYRREGTYPAWVHRRMKLRCGDGGARAQDAFDVRIDSRLLRTCCTGDVIFFGKTSEPAPDLSKCRRVSAVSDSRFGGSPHWHLKAEFDYR